MGSEFEKKIDIWITKLLCCTSESNTTLLINYTLVWNKMFFSKVIPKGEKRNKISENILEDKITENFPNMRKEIDIQVKEVESGSTGSTQEPDTKTHSN